MHSADDSAQLWTDFFFSQVPTLHLQEIRFECSSRDLLSVQYMGSSKGVIFTCIVYLDSNIATISLKPIWYFIKRSVVTAPVNNAGSWTFFVCALPGSLFAGTRCVRNGRKYSEQCT